MLFKNEFYFLSNMYPCEVKINFDGELVTFKCAESAFHAHKNFNEINKFVNLDGCSAKKLGRKVKLQGDWNNDRLEIMKKVVRKKFEQNPELIDKLIDIKGEIVEDNYWGDTFWGVCNGVGENNLGKILMQLRDEYSSLNTKDNMFYCLVVGSRTFNDYSCMCKVLDHLLQNKKEITIVSGGARGADNLAEQYAKEHGYDLKVFPADWNKYGKSAGYKRNTQMHEFIALHKNRGVIAFWDGSSKGTTHNFDLVKQYNTPIRVYNYLTNKYIKV